MTIVRRIVTSLALASAVALSAPGLATAADSLEETLVKFANTPAEHQALADYYESQAAAARSAAEEHRKMGKTYSGQKASQMQAMAAHCEKLAAAQDELAKQFDELAAGHKAMAK